MASLQDLGWEIVKAILTGSVGFLAGRWTKRADAKASDERAFEDLRNIALHENSINHLSVRLRALRDFMATRHEMLDIEINRTFWNKWLQDSPVMLGIPVNDPRWTRARVDDLHSDLKTLKYR